MADEKTEQNRLGPQDVCAIIQRRARQLDRALDGDFDPNAIVLHIDGMLHVALALKHMLVGSDETTEAKAN